MAGGFPVALTCAGRGDRDEKRDGLMGRKNYMALDYKGVDPKAFRSRMRYASFVSTKRKLLYVETPKAACSSLKWVMAALDGPLPTPVAKGGETQPEMAIHYRDVHPLPAVTELPPETGKGILLSGAYRRFCVVRNPYTRLLAAWSNKIRQIEPGYAADCAEIHRFHGRSERHDAPSFRDFALWVVASNPDTCNPHWRAQTKLLYPQIVPYDFVLKTETLADGLQAVFDAGAETKALDARALLERFRHNESLPFDQSGMFDEELAAKVAAHYAEDFTAYGYDVESWRSVAKKPPTFEALEAAALAAIQHRNRVIEEMAEKERMRAKSLAGKIGRLFRR